MKHLFDTSSLLCSRIVTQVYSTSFSRAITLLAPSVRPAIYGIYGFVRLADEIVDSFNAYNQEELFLEFENDYHQSLKRHISTNPVLNTFQAIVHQYKLFDMVDDFMASMKMDLYKKEYNTVDEYTGYIYGSADVVGLMCLMVFVNGDKKRFEALKPYAMKLGSAFQKVNFLRDYKDDTEVLGRTYFPNLKNKHLDNESKKEIIKDIEADFAEAYKGVVQLPMEGRLGVYLAYRYYRRLLYKLKIADCAQILRERVRVNDFLKLKLLVTSYLRYKLNVI